MTWRTDGKYKASKRKPLSDVSNSAIYKASKKSVVKLNKNLTSLKKMKPKNEQINVNVDPLHRLLSIHSDVSSLLRQIDEVVVEAFKVKIDDEKSEEINSFTNVLSEIQSSLKPWILRLQKALAAPCTDSDVQLGENSVKAPVLNENEEDEVDTPEPTTRPSLVSPSPLVSWRATDFTADVGKQLFLLTPLPRPKPSTSKPPASVKPTICKDIASSRAIGVPPLGDPGKSDNYLPEKGASTLESTSELEFLSPSKTSTCDLSTVLTTPCLKNSPPLSCVLQEPYHPFSFRKIDQFHKSTPFPVGHRKFCESTDSESSSGEVSEKLGLKYPELIGIKPSCTIISERKVLEESPAWIRSPPKCCALMEPLDEKPVKHYSPLNDRLQKLTSTFDQQLSLGPKQSNVYIDNQAQANKKGNFIMAECTPLWKGSKSVLKTGKRPGENTLKKELWTRFEAASSRNDFDLNFQETTSQKGFLDRLDEAS